jgi:hypothetical protein
MSYCTLDEAFGNTYLNQQNRVNSNVDKHNSLDSCVKRSKIRRKKINCNETKNRFDSNNKDLQLNGYNPKKGTYELINNMTQKNNNNNLPGISSFSFFPENYEHFTSSNENMNPAQNNSQNSLPNNIVNNLVNNSGRNNSGRNNSVNNSRRNNSRRNNSRRNNTGRNNVRNAQPNEIFEYSEEENFPIESSSDYEIVNSTDEESETEPENNIIEETEESVPGVNKNNRNNIVNNSNNVIASQISEINNKINFLMNSMNNDNENSENVDFKENNIHDIILFVIFGVFVLLVLESLFKLATKILLSKNGVKINL